MHKSFVEATVIGVAIEVVDMSDSCEIFDVDAIMQLGFNIAVPLGIVLDSNLER